MRVHFIAIGGSAMHNLAIAMHDSGHIVTGSDDEIFEPSRSRLAVRGLLPPAIGWFPEKIQLGIDIVILGMHARKDNPELQRAIGLGINVMSYPEFLYELFKNKRRIVVAGSHGKTSVTGMILHILKESGVPFDYMVGAQLPGFDCMVGISDAEIAIIEGDEYLASPIHPEPKFLFYQPDIAVITGIAWDHINVFPTFEEYVLQFERFIATIPDNGTLVWYKRDNYLQRLVEPHAGRLNCIGYEEHPYVSESGYTFLLHDSEKTKIPVFGAHNMQNLLAAYHVVSQLGISDDTYYRAVQTFPGAARRLELLSEKNDSFIYRDFAHAPSKLKATVRAVREQYPNQKLIACIELHTFSSLNRTFLTQYKDSMQGADVAIVYYNPAVLAHKKLESVTVEQVQSAFGNPVPAVYTDAEELKGRLRSDDLNKAVLLLMSSGNFDGMDLVEFSKALHATSL